MLQVSRDGRRVYLTNSLYGVWDDIFYADGVGAWMAKLDVDQDHHGLRVHQTRLQGGDASSDSYCHTR
jgi:methanethiol oxidase